MTGSSFGINTITPGAYALNVNGTTLLNSDATISGKIYANGNKLNFPNILDQYKINLWGTNEFGFGIASSTLTYSSNGNHSFYNSSNNANTFSIDGSGNTSCTGTLTSGMITCPAITCTSTTTGLYVSGGNSVLNGNVGIKNLFPWTGLNIGDCSVVGSSGQIVFGKNSGGGNRNFQLGMSSNFFFCIGDCGNVNNSSNTWTQSFGISYQAPASSFTITSTGSVIMPNGWTSSDERIKTNIKTIENALDKTLLLRGVEYNNFKIDPEQKCLGLIAQEVELIIPEAVSVNEVDNIKCISYNSLIGVLIEAIKEQQALLVLERAERVEQQQQINELKLILKNNNLK